MISEKKYTLTNKIGLPTNIQKHNDAIMMKSLFLMQIAMKTNSRILVAIRNQSCASKNIEARQKRNTIIAELSPKLMSVKNAIPMPQESVSEPYIGTANRMFAIKAMTPSRLPFARIFSVF